MSHVIGTALAGLDGTVGSMACTRDLTDEQWALPESLFNAPGKRGPRHAPDLRRVVDAMLYVSHTGCQVALPARVIGALDAGVVAVPPLVTHRHLGRGR